ncbi:hypothetical protein E2C01_039972 [Portunus trituberculatus]|uniref:Uncharacterized protein n=1 Tax=Portunus trituberculatus TaxID=210409 RepID=A0A5B7FMP9_PORTR|nr:hypothetical protein [Portunus trituberculatus]
MHGFESWPRSEGRKSTHGNDFQYAKSKRSFNRDRPRGPRAVVEGMAVCSWVTTRAQVHLESWWGQVKDEGRVAYHTPPKDPPDLIF